MNGLKQVMVVGASGVLGRLICTELLRIFHHQMTLIVTDYREDRGKRFAESIHRDAIFRHLDVTNEEGITQAIQHVDMVIVVVKQQNPYIQRACINHRITCIDVTPFADFVDQVKLLHHDAENQEAGSIVMSGFFPGLSGFMVKQAISGFQEITEVNIGLLQNTNANVGITGILDMLKIISQRVQYSSDNGTVSLPGFTKKRKMQFLDPYHEREVRLIDHAEKGVLAQKLQIDSINYWTGWNQSSFNKQIAILKSLGIINRILKLKNRKFLSKVVKHDPNQHEQAFLTVEVKGRIDHKACIRTLSLSTFSDYHTTAMVTAALAKIAIHKKFTGVVFPFEITDIDEILTEINCNEIVLKEFIQ